MKVICNAEVNHSLIKLGDRWTLCLLCQNLCLGLESVSFEEKEL